MSTKNGKSGPEDTNQAAFRVVQQLTGQCPEPESQPEESVKVRAGRLGGQKGGAARAAKLSAEERSAIAKAAALKRWGAKAPDHH